MKRKYLTISFAALLLISCSDSEKEEVLYDEILSHTEWVQIYTTPSDKLTEEYYSDLPEYIKNRLDVEMLGTETKTDTIREVKSSSGKYTLSFSNDKCTLENSYKSEGKYKIHSYLQTEYHYPDQSHSYTDEEGNYLYELTVKEYFLTYRIIYIRNGAYNVTNEAEQYIGHIFETSTLSMSDPVPYSTKKKETIHMKFERNGRNITFYGDKNMEGVMNDACDEIELGGIGTLYLK